MAETLYERDESSGEQGDEGSGANEQRTRQINLRGISKEQRLLLLAGCLAVAPGHVSVKSSGLVSNTPRAATLPRPA